MSLNPRWFEDEDFRFRLGTVPGNVEDFFALSPDANSVLAERRKWLTTDTERYAAMLPDARAIVAEFLQVAADWPMLQDIAQQLRVEERSEFDRMLLLSKHLEPDFVLLAPADTVHFIAVAGCVCFPSSWRLTDKIGLPVADIHEPVPQLNPILGTQIDRLLGKLSAGKCVVRANWGVCSTPELNQHPDRSLPGLQSRASLDHAWLRREDQCLFTLPRTNGILFGIRVTHISWQELRSDPFAAHSVARGLRTMPAAMREYKRLQEVYSALAELLERG